MNPGFFNNWTNQARKGILVLTILNDIRNRRMYGYEIKRKFRKSKGLLISEGAIYTILRRLKQQGLVKIVQSKSHDGPMRKHYHLTETGLETLNQMNIYWQALSQAADAIDQNK